MKTFKDLKVGDQFFVIDFSMLEDYHVNYTHVTIESIEHYDPFFDNGWYINSGFVFKLSDGTERLIVDTAVYTDSASDADTEEIPLSKIYEYYGVIYTTSEETQNFHLNEILKVANERISQAKERITNNKKEIKDLETIKANLKSLKY